MLLAERLRDPEEREVVKEVLQKFLKAAIDPAEMYAREGTAPFQQLQARLADADTPPEAAGALQTIAWSASLQRLYTLVNRCLAAGTFLFDGYQRGATDRHVPAHTCLPIRSY